MSFVYNNASLNGSKVNRAPLPGGEDPNKWIQANEDWNPTISAIYDLRAGIISNEFLGIARQLVAPPVPVDGATDFLWASSAGDLYWHKNGSGDQLLTGGGSLAALYAVGLIAADQTLLIKSSAGGPVIFKANGAATGSLVKSQTSTAVNLFDVNDNGTQLIRSAMADGASAVAFAVDTSAAWVNATAKILSLRNNAVETAYVLGTGDAYFNGVVVENTVAFGSPMVRGTAADGPNAYMSLTANGNGATWGGTGITALQNGVDSEVLVTIDDNADYGFTKFGMFLTNTKSIGGNAATGVPNPVAFVAGQLFTTTVGAALTITANTIAPVAEVHHVGAGLLKTITVPLSGNFRGFVALYADSTFTYDATDNIAGSGTVNAGTQAIVVYDGSKWSFVAGGGAAASTLSAVYAAGTTSADQTLTISGATGDEPILSVAAVGTGQVPGLTLLNPTAATSGAGNQKWSPGLKLTGQQWNGASSVVVDAMIQASPLTGSINPPDLSIMLRYNGGAWANRATFTDLGGGLGGLYLGPKTSNDYIFGGNGTFVIRANGSNRAVFTDASSNTLASNMADGATAVGTILDTASTWSNAGAKLLSIRNGGAEQLWIGQPAAAGYWEIRSETAQIGLRNSARSGIFVAGDATTFYDANSAIASVDAASLRPFADLGNQLGDTAHRWLAIYGGNDAVGTAQTAGLALSNNTTAAVGAQKFSPMIELTGQGWKTDATAASQTVKWALQTRPVQGAANPTGDLVFWTSINGGAYSERMSLQSGSTGLTGRLVYLADTDAAAIGPIIARSLSNPTIGTAITLDATSDASGHAYSFISTGTSAGVGPGCFAVFDGTSTAYRLVIDSSSNVMPGADLAGALGTYTKRWATVEQGNDVVGTGQTIGVRLSNKTAATAGNQKFSPMLEMEGQGWKTNATAASQSVKWAMQVRPVQGAANPGAELVFWSNVNGAGYVDMLDVTEVNPAYGYLAGRATLSLSPASGAGYVYHPTVLVMHVGNSGGNFLQVDSSGVTIQTALLSYTAGSATLGVSANKFAATWSRSYYGTQQNNTASGAITVDPTQGDVYKLTSNGNVTGITINTGTYDGQLLTLILVQNAGGTNTWPTAITNATLASGSFTKTTTASAVDALTFRYDSNSTKWREVGRAMTQS